MNNCKGNNLFCDIRAFNDMYKLETPAVPTIIADRLEQFTKIIKEEVNEQEEIEASLLACARDINVLVMLADWLGDIIIYCMSEMLRWGLDPETVLRIIMQSNFSKLGADGNPIYDERGKVLKGPNYWKPEPSLEAYIRSKLEPVDDDK